MKAASHSQEDQRKRIRPYLRLMWKFAVLVAVLIAASHAGEWVRERYIQNLTPSTEPTIHRFIMIGIAIYIVLMMLPFVPGIEIGLGMMMTFGSGIIPLVYGATVLALVMAFLIGRLIPQQSIIEILETMRLTRAGRMIRQLEPLDSSQRLEFLLQNTSTRLVPILLRYRFLALMVALNLPGNAALGGGGGICMIAGFSRLFSISRFALAVAVAVSPIPLMIFLTGK